MLPSNQPISSIYSWKRWKSQKTIHKFANDVNAELTIMKNGEHWFHTAEQMSFLDDGIKKYIR